ncbi:MAG: hypothetical protein CML03_08120 [Pseudooceanicola sp.]|nr:hypothetical protein [Pseudooceanicola sp.]
MTTYLSKDLYEGLEAARKLALRKSARLHVVAGDKTYPILHLHRQGFVVSSTDVPPLRGIVDVYEGSRMLWHCLIVAASEDDGEMHYEFKQQTAALTGPALDFVKQANAPAGYLTSS